MVVVPKKTSNPGSSCRNARIYIGAQGHEVCSAARATCVCHFLHTFAAAAVSVNRNSSIVLWMKRTITAAMSCYPG